MNSINKYEWFQLIQLCTVQLCIVQLCTVQLCTVQLCTVQLCTIQLCTVQLCTVQLCTVQLCTVQMCTVQLCTVQLCTVQLCIVQPCTIQLCTVQIIYGTVTKHGGRAENVRLKSAYQLSELYRGFTQFIIANAKRGVGNKIHHANLQNIPSTLMINFPSKSTVKEAAHLK
jgi:hypothetical protein